MNPLELARLALAHWRGLSVVALVALAGAGGGRVGWLLHKPAPCAACVAVASRSSSTSSTGELERRTSRGPETIADRWYAPASPCAATIVGRSPDRLTIAPPAGVLVRERLVTLGPTLVDVKRDTASASSSARSLALELRAATPGASSSPRFSVAWLPEVRPALGLGVLELGVRLDGDAWLKLAAAPASRQVFAGLELGFGR